LPDPSLPATNAKRLLKGALATKQSSFAAIKLDCFAEPVIGRRFAPTRWLAMTLMDWCARQNRSPGGALAKSGATAALIPGWSQPAALGAAPLAQSGATKGSSLRDARE